MKREDIVTTLANVAKELASDYGVKSMALFGSVTTADWTPESDVDVVVEFEGTATFDRLFGLHDRLESLLGVRVDLVTRKGLRPRLLRTIDEHSIRVA